MRKESVRAMGGERSIWRVVSLALGITACAPHVASFTDSSRPNGRRGLCELLAPPVAAAPSLRIAVTDAISPSDAPLPRTDAERVIFPLLYTPSATVACHDRPTGVWPATTGRYEVVAAVDTALDLAPRRSTLGPVLHVSRIRADAGRDALDGGTDVLITSDATTIAYAAARADFVNLPLPWGREYVLIQPAPPANVDRDTARALDSDLAADAVRVEARGVDDPQWGEVLAACDTAARPAQVGAPDTPHASAARGTVSPDGAPLVNRIVYTANDAVARALSERLVALANAHDTRLTALAPTLTALQPVRASGLDTTQMRALLAAGHDVAYVASIDVTGICRDVATVVSDAPWVARDTQGLREAITPLIETRARAIVRRGRVGVAVDDAGDVYLEFGSPARS
jgi:hypothetical protein